MSVFAIKFLVDDYRILVPVNSEDFDGGNLWINGAMKLSSWNPPKMRWSDPEDNISIPDIAYISPGFYAFNEKSIEVLGELLAQYGELLELPVDGELWMAFNPTTERDCLDHNKTEWKIRRNGERGRLIKPVMVESAYANSAIFQVPETIKSTFYVTDEFMQLVVTNQLKGLEFIKLETS